MNNTTEEKREAIPNSVSRMLLAGIGVLLQVLWIFWLALKLNDYSTSIQVCTSVLTFLIRCVYTGCISTPRIKFRGSF